MRIADVAADAFADVIQPSITDLFGQERIGDRGAVSYTHLDVYKRQTLTTAAWAHILVGIAVLALLIWRIELRLMRGVPDEPATSSAMMVKASLIVHWVLYAVMFLAPITGLVAWYGGVAVVAEVHELLKPVLIVLIAGHFAAALWHQVWLKDNLMERMKRPAD